MMTAIIIEDERLSADRLKGMLEKNHPSIQVLSTLDSVAMATDWFRDNSNPDLLFLDIQLTDGTAFDLLGSDLIKCPIIFTTAYDNFAVRAFKYNSVDYILKPIDEDELSKAIGKFLHQNDLPDPQDNGDSFRKLQRIMNGEFKRRFLVKLGDRFQPIDVEEIAYFFYEDGITYLRTKANKKWPVDHTLEHLEDLLNPLHFFRVNRKTILCLKAISEIHTYFNGRLLLSLMPESGYEVIVSRDRVADFKQWMDL